MKRFFRLHYLFWLVVPLLLWWALRNVSVTEVWAVLRQLTPTEVLLLLVANTVVLLLFSARWWIISRAQGYPIPYFTLSGYRLAAFGMSYFTPGPQVGGEPLQVYLTERKHNIPRATAIAAVSLDKLLEFLFNFTFLIFGIMLVLQGQIFPAAMGQQAMTIAVVLLILVAGLLLAVFAGQHPVSDLWKIITRWLPPSSATTYGNIYQTIKDSEDQTAQLFWQHPLSTGMAVGVSVITLLVMIGEFWLATYMLGLKLNFVQLISLLIAARIAFLLPAPGGLGALEASLVIAFTALNLNPAVGLSLTLLIRVRDIALGATGLLWGGNILQSNKELSRVSIKT